MIKELITDKKDNLKQNLKEQKNQFWIFGLILINALYYSLYFKFDESIWINIFTVDIIFICFGLLITMIHHKKNSASTLLIFFTVIKLIGFFISSFGHDIAILNNFLLASTKSYLKILSLLIVLSGTAVGILYSIYLLSSSSFRFFEKISLNKNDKKHFKVISYIFLIGFELVFYGLIYKYAIYDLFLGESRKILDSIEFHDNKEILAKAFDLLKPLLSFLSFPLLLIINKVNRSHVFSSRGEFIQASIQLALLIDYAHFNKIFPQAYLPIVFISYISCSWTLLLYILIKTIRLNINLKANEDLYIFSLLNKKTPWE